MPSVKDVCRSAIRLYGEEHQLRKTQEELAELSVAIAHKLEGREGADEEWLEELADVHIMMVQNFIMADTKKLDASIDFKKDRLRKRIDEHTKA